MDEKVCRVLVAALRAAASFCTFESGGVYSLQFTVWYGVGEYIHVLPVTRIEDKDRILAFQA